MQRSILGNIALLQQTSVTQVTLSHGDDRCCVLPALGGSIGDWRVGGQAMLRTASAATIANADPFGCASFPLVPYSNRIANGRFEWDGMSISLTANFPPEPHAIHGVGFEQAWVVDTLSSANVVLRLRHEPNGAWPWPFAAEQRVSLGNGQLDLHLRAVNLADRAVPLAFGHHPYFPRDGALLKFSAAGVWLTGNDHLPSRLVEPFDQFDYAQAKPITSGDIDHCFSGWDGRAYIAWRDQPLALEIEATGTLPHVVVCIRQDLDGFCFEPVPHVTDAVNRRHCGLVMPVIEPGEAFTAAIRFRAVQR